MNIFIFNVTFFIWNVSIIVQYCLKDKLLNTWIPNNKIYTSKNVVQDPEKCSWWVMECDHMNYLILIEGFLLLLFQQISKKIICFDVLSWTIKKKSSSYFFYLFIHFNCYFNILCILYVFLYIFTKLLIYNIGIVIHGKMGNRL